MRWPCPGAASTAVTVTPETVPDAPSGLVATAGDQQAEIAFTPPQDTGGQAISDYEYAIDGGAWTSASSTASPITITGLTNGTAYSITLRAITSAGAGAFPMNTSPRARVHNHNNRPPKGSSELRNTVRKNSSVELRGTGRI